MWNIQVRFYNNHNNGTAYNQRTVQVPASNSYEAQQMGRAMFGEGFHCVNGPAQ